MYLLSAESFFFKEAVISYIRITMDTPPNGQYITRYFPCLMQKIKCTIKILMFKYCDNISRQVCCVVSVKLAEYLRNCFVLSYAATI